MLLELANIELLVTGLLLLAILVAWISDRIRFPYTVGLVIVGVVLSIFVPDELHLEPQLARELILFLLLPPLVFESGLHINFEDFRDDLPAILTYAIPGVLITTGLVGVLMHYLTGLPFESMLVFGALIAATDPVAVIAIFRELGLPKRLELIVEGESLLNDATAIVIFGIVLEFALHPDAFNTLDGILAFIRVVGMGGVIGLVMGMLYLIRQINDYLIEIALSAVIAYGSYLLAEQIHASGVLAVLIAGIMIGNGGKKYGMSHTTRNLLNHIWEFMAFMANSFVFLLIGFTIRLGDLVRFWQLVLAAIGVVLLVRLIAVYGFTPLSNWLGLNRIPSKWQTIIVWGGLRGGVALALSLTLPVWLFDRDLILVMTIGVVLFTLLVQATTLAPFLRWTGMVGANASQIEYQRRQARLAAARAAQRYLKKRVNEGLISHEGFDTINPELEERIAMHVGTMHEALNVLPNIRDDELEITRRRMLQVERDALHTMYRDGIIARSVYDELAADIDAQLATDL